jgi:hypothetical protein
LAKSKSPTTETLQDQLSKQYQDAWTALTPLRDTWDEKEQTLLARANDSFGGNVVRARITDAGLSTLAFERQARVAAQLPSGKIYAVSEADEGKAKLANIVLQRYIIPNANSQKDMLVKQRMWGIYASVYGSMPMFYDYRVDDEYIGPDCWLVDPRNFAPQPGRNSVQECDWVMISTVVTVKELQRIAKRKNTSWNKDNIQKLTEVAKDAKPSKIDDSQKDSETSRLRYNKSVVKGQVELVTKYEKGEDGHWITFAPDYKEVGVLRDIPNPHKSGRIPVVMRDCFPLLNSIYGLSDFERGMKIQKAKDSLLALRLEFVKNKVYPAMLIDMSKVTPSTIKYGAGQKMRVTDVNASVKPLSYGNDSESGFQNTFSVLNGIQQDQFGTSNTTLGVDDASNPQFGRTPAALAMQKQQENSRDTWDRFMHEKATEELYEGMINLLSVKMEKPINFTIFEEEIRQLSADAGEDVAEDFVGQKPKVPANQNITVPKGQLKSSKGFKYTIDSNSSMKQDDEAQLQALMETYQMAAQDPNLQAALQAQGYTWDQAEHYKSILIASGISDWDRILQEGREQNPQQQLDPSAAQPVDPNMQQQAQIQPPQTDFSQHPALSSQDPQIQQFAQQVLGT